MEGLLPLHVLAGTLGLLTGAGALVAAKGGRAHRRAGIAFVLAMVVMALSGALIAAHQGTRSSTVAGLLTAYLVLTALATVRPAPRALDAGLMAGALALGVASLIWAAADLFGTVEWRDAGRGPVLLVFGLVALGGGLGDLRMVRGRPLRGPRRLARHLWRMCFALWIASASFFLGQMGVIPEPLRVLPALILLAFLPLLVMLYWLWRVRVGGSLRGLARRGEASPAAPGTPVAGPSASETPAPSRSAEPV